jgi:two-component system uhpT operon response regulator UhpA
VWDTGDAREAVRRFAAALPAEQPDIVIVDLAMPDLAGMRMVEVIAAISPGVRVIYLTEHPQLPASQAAGPGSVIATLHKPVAVEKLLEALDGATGR